MRYCDRLTQLALAKLSTRYGLRLRAVSAEAPIPGTYWGAPEAGLTQDGLYVRADTPLHSALHELAHFVCMDSERRSSLHGDAGGSTHEEESACYLQVLFSDYVDDFGRQRCFADMDAWGYSFRLGSSAAWFHRDATSAQAWLLHHRLVSGDFCPSWSLRR